MRWARGFAIAVALTASCRPSPEPFAKPVPATSATATATAPPPFRFHARSDGVFQIEAEDFTPDGPGWSKKPWGAGYYASTLSNTLESGKAFLGAPSHSETVVARAEVEVGDPGDYVPLVRYEAPYRFSAEFRLKIEQNGSTVFEHLYGSRTSERVFPFRIGLAKEAPYAWGATENMVWEGHDQRAHLAAGPATLTLVAAEQTGDAAERNVDVILLTKDADDVAQRIAKEGQLPLDGLLTQAGQVFARVRSRAGAMTLVVPPGTEHSPYWVHTRVWKPHEIAVEAGASSEWIDVGDVLDSLNDGQWTLGATPKEKGAPLDYVVDFGVPDRDGSIAAIASFEQTTPSLRLVYDADTRLSKRVRREDDVLFELLDSVRNVTVHGTPPSETPIYALGFDAVEGDEPRSRAIHELNELLGITAPMNDPLDPLANDRGALPRRYLERGSASVASLAAECKAAKDKGGDPTVTVISLGDEIALSAPPEAPGEFAKWLRTRGVSLRDIGATSWNDVRPDASTKAREQNGEAFYLSSLFEAEKGIEAEKRKTDALAECFPNAGIGANFSPHPPAYLGHASQWITLFRRGALTMPWTEDYAWMIPVASPQMSELSLDLLRAGIRGRDDERIHAYVMPHTPGNTPDAFRRQLFAALMHGAKVLNLFEARPVQAAYTENYVNDPAMYAEIRTSLHKLGLFDDIVQRGTISRAKIALWFSQAGEFWDDDDPPFGAAKRTLWLLLRQLGFQVDIVDEEDALAGRLDDYETLVLTDRHVSRAASAVLAKRTKWILATASAGMLDERGAANDVLRRRLGVEEISVELAREPIRFEKQDLPFAAPIATLHATASDRAIAAFGLHGRVSPLPGVTWTTTAQFSDGAPAAVLDEAHHTSLFAFLPGLSYVAPALPRIPVDRTPRPGSSAHLMPVSVDRDIAAMVARALPVDDLDVRTSDPFVEAGTLTSGRGTAIVLVSWRASPVKALRVTIPKTYPTGSFALASGRAISFTESDTTRTYTLDLDVADALVLR